MEAPKREPFESRGPVDRERFEPRLVENEARGPLNLAARRDITRWGPILGGFVATVATAILLSVLGGALGLSAAGTAGGIDLNSGSAIWGGIVLLISFFVGGYVASRTAPGHWVSAVVNSSLVWAISLVFAVLLAAIGLGSLMGLLGFSVPSLFGITPGTTAATAQTATALWAAFIGMLVALAAAVIGGLVGMHSDVETYDYR